MQGFGRYILSVGLASLLVGIIGEFSDKKSSAGILTRMVCGLFLAFTVINPLADLNFGILEAFSKNYNLDGTSAVEAGTALTEKSLRSIIKQETEAYILDKAGSLGCTLQADVTVSEGPSPVPVAVRITGEVPQKIRRQLKDILELELGISKENQQWIG